MDATTSSEEISRAIAVGGYSREELDTLHHAFKIAYSLLEQRNDLRALLKAIVSDVDAQRAESAGHWFSGFSAWNWNGDFPEEMEFEWPNLSILIDQARELTSKHL